ncbi:S4 domain-containing protein YaaA [Peribacillus psychrosaccharolyticus]|uniref:S4 domain-containing protein YaaA n=1 Tax=Peribacillus psychrosaccharolyticus TaxID=1407 RepID=A0A974NJC2_PERPY|nr:S4 domain-containing protein YaaA [Peribacillus psychrosaccharolyticus]QQS98864.1 S4 domain-containing protein YaaA [Peribacillus psychrosaccharolyticus]
MQITEIQIQTEYITLGQFLKLADIIQSGGMAKAFLGENDVFINEEFDVRRGRKLREGDIIDIPDIGIFIITR